ncbi:MAG: hypothetical protein P0Y53_15685 [Candidatus Pseudobacter hemicellulosilyticus]|uniref:Uncharacterized protein n=1 Tax=Candidatus Pseudobacter hemicellulosilyticus TaxID=3121375 RepID=A0AAJ5WT05_9BACT|nr:MAG: hypothetical protein P0Y53_15685 [Pseudobacter sp.]
MRTAKRRRQATGKIRWWEEEIHQEQGWFEPPCERQLMMNFCGEWRWRLFVGRRMIGASPEGYATCGECIKDAIRHDYDGN